MKIILDHVAGSRRGQRQEFDTVERLRFGRHPDNDVSFDAHRDLDASSRHAELRRNGAGYVLRDVGSSNGTFVNGEKVTEYPLGDGEQIEVEFGAGGPRLRIFVGEVESVPVPPTLPAEVPHTVAADGGPGSRTMAMMYRAARDRAHEKHGLAKSSVFVRSFVDQALHSSSRKFKVIAVATGGVLVAAIIGLLLWQSAERSRMDDERRADRERFAQIERDTMIRQDLLQRLQMEGPGPVISSHFGPAVWLFIVERSDQEMPQGFCTGFAVNASYLGTNAHCVDALRRYEALDHKVYLLRNGSGERLEIARHTKHAKYRGGLTEDVGLVKVKGHLDTTVELSDPTHLQELRSGANIFTLGFPGRLAKRIDDEAPEATIVNGIIGRITNFKGKQATFEEELLVQHNLLTSPGTSGSPVFDGFGKVIAVNAGSYTDQREDVIVDPETGQQRKVARTILTPGANYGIRIDALLGLMATEKITAEVLPATDGAAGEGE